MGKEYYSSSEKCHKKQEKCHKRKEGKLKIIINIPFGNIIPPIPPPVLPVNAYTIDNARLEIIGFNTADPSSILSRVTINGLILGETAVGITRRPINGLYYIVSSFSRLFTIDPISGLVGLVGSLTVPLSGTRFAIDFNPVPDRIRIISNTGQNLRVDPNNAATIVDGNIVGSTVTGVAYTNSFPGATTTTLYAIDTTNSTLNIIASPNAGGVPVTVGPLGLFFAQSAGMDISPTTGIAYSLFNPGIGTSLYTINLTTGAATSLGNVGTGGEIFTGLALNF